MEDGTGDKPAFVLADGLLYPMGEWLSAFTDAAFLHFDARLPRSGVRAIIRALHGMKTERDLHAIQRKACAFLRERGFGVSPEDAPGSFEISASFTVDNTVPPL